MAGLPPHLPQAKNDTENQVWPHSLATDFSTETPKADPPYQSALLFTAMFPHEIPRVVKLGDELRAYSQCPLADATRNLSAGTDFGLRAFSAIPSRNQKTRRREPACHLHPKQSSDRSK
jgi:hypothetical protein